MIVACSIHTPTGMLLYHLSQYVSFIIHVSVIEITTPCHARDATLMLRSQRGYATLCRLSGFLSLCV